MWRGKNNMLAIVLLCISSGILTARCILLVLFSILTLGPPPCIFNARTVATRTTTFGCRPETRHLMLKNFSIPMSAPKPASVTVRKHEWHEAEKPTQTSHKSKIIYLKCKYFIQMLSYFFAAPDPAGATLVQHRKTMQRGAQKKRGQQFTELPSVQENWNEKWVHRAWAKPKGLWYGGPYTQASWTRSKLSKLSTWNDSLCWDKLSCCCACVSGPYCVWHHSSEALAVTPNKTFERKLESDFTNTILWCQNDLVYLYRWAEGCGTAHENTCTHTCVHLWQNTEGNQMEREFNRWHMDGLLKN